jgi:hypothetical protein
MSLGVNTWLWERALEGPLSLLLAWSALKETLRSKLQKDQPRHSLKAAADSLYELFIVWRVGQTPDSCLGADSLFVRGKLREVSRVGQTDLQPTMKWLIGVNFAEATNSVRLQRGESEAGTERIRPSR